MKWIALWIVLAGGNSPDATNDEPGAQPEIAAKAESTANKTDQLSKTNSKSERSITEFRRDVRNGLRAEATAKDGTTSHHDAIGTLINLHREIVRHSTFENGFSLKESRSLLQSRLVRIERDIRKQFNAPRDREFSPQKGRAPARVHVAATPVLAQQVVPIGGQPGVGGIGGGAGQPNGGGIGGQLPDFGPDLADLIQQVIDPDFWDVNGGPGTIVYFQPLKALVISATTEVHDNLADVLGQLRAAP